MEKAIRYLGIGLVLFSLSFLIFIYYPFINLYFNHPELKMITIEWTITIPKIYAQAPLVMDVDPWNETNYSQALKKGVAMAKGFAKPGEKGVSYLFAHSSLPPWEITRTNIAFLRLGELNNGDEILITKDDKKYKYIVVDKKEVWPSQVDLLDKIKGKDILVLQTCTPIGTSLKRLLVFAKPI